MLTRFNYVKPYLNCVHVGQRCKIIRHSKLFVMRKMFAENAYPSKATLRTLSEQLGLSESKLNAWFTDRRYRVKIGSHNIETSSIGKNVYKST